MAQLASMRVFSRYLRKRRILARDILMLHRPAWAAVTREILLDTPYLAWYT